MSIECNMVVRVETSAPVLEILLQYNYVSCDISILRRIKYMLKWSIEMY